MEQAIQELNSAKRWVENAFNDSRPRIDQCETQFKKFQTLYATKSSIIKGSPAEKDWATYHDSLPARYADLKAADDAQQIVNKGRFNLRFLESNIKDRRPDQAQKYLADFQKNVAELKDARFARATEAINFLKEVEPRMTTLETDAKNIAIAVEMEQELSGPIQMATRGGLDRSLSTGPTKAQAALEQMQETVDQFKAKWGDHPTGLALLKPVEEKMAATWKAIKDADSKRAAEADAESAKIEKKLNDIVDTLPGPMKTCIKEKKCTFSITGKNFRMQPYFACRDCGPNIGLCIPCRNICHKQAKYESHRIEPQFKKGDSYCDCGCEFADCIAMPGREAAAAAAVKAAASAAPTTAAGLKIKPGTEFDPAFTIDLSTDRSVTTAQRELLQRYTNAAKSFNEKWRDFLKQYDALLKKEVTRYHVLKIACDDLNSCSTYAEWMVDVGEKLEEHPHPIRDEIAATGKKLLSLVEENRLAAQERSEKAERDFHLEDLFTRAKGIFDAGVENKNSTGQFHADNNWATIETVFPRFEESAARLIAEAGDKPHPTVDKIKPMIEQAKKMHEEVCVTNGIKAANEQNFYDADKFITALSGTQPNSPGVAKIGAAIDAAKKKQEAERLVREKAAAEKQAKAAEAERKRKEEMRDKWLRPYTGGTLKVGGRQWTYGADGTIMGPDGIKITYDGSAFGCETLGGEISWDGTTFMWYSHYDTHCVYKVKDGRIESGSPAPVDWDWVANAGRMLPKGGNGKFDAAERTGSVPYPVILMVVMYNWIKRKYMMLNGECMCNQRLFDKGEKAYLCNDCHINRGHLCPICDTQFVIKRNPASVCWNHSLNTQCVVCKNGCAGWKHDAFVCDNCAQNLKDGCIMRNDE